VPVKFFTPIFVVFYFWLYELFWVDYDRNISVTGYKIYVCHRLHFPNLHKNFWCGHVSTYIPRLIVTTHLLNLTKLVFVQIIKHLYVKGVVSFKCWLFAGSRSVQRNLHAVKTPEIAKSTMAMIDKTVSIFYSFYLRDCWFYLIVFSFFQFNKKATQLIAFNSCVGAKNSPSKFFREIKFICARMSKHSISSFSYTYDKIFFTCDLSCFLYSWIFPYDLSFQSYRKLMR
jgi:hypothetical protein